MSRTSSLGQASSSSVASFRSSVTPSVTTVTSRCLTREDMLQQMLAPKPQPSPPPREPSIEELLAQCDDSSEDETEGRRDAGGETDEEWQGYALLLGRQRKRVRKPSNTLGLDNVSGGAPFAFSIGPSGSFSVATDEHSSTPIVPVSRKRPASRIQSESAKRSRVASGVPPTPPLTTSTNGRSPSPGPTVSANSLPTGSLSTPSTTPSLREVTKSPSLRAISMSPSNSQHSLPDKSSRNGASSYAGLLRREREEYITYNIYKERNRGFAMSHEVEKAMDAWTADAKAKGRLAPITKHYLASLGIDGDPRKQDLAPFLRKSAQKGWSPTESLLRLGIQPREFPHRLMIHSVITLHEQLGITRLSSALAPIGKRIDDAQLETELDALFAAGGESWRDLFVSAEEADDREKAYLKVGAWSYDRTVPEGPANRLDGEVEALETLQKRSNARRTTTRVSHMFGFEARSSRINYDALRRLENGDEEDDAYDAFVLHGAPGMPGLLAAAEEDIDESDEDMEDGKETDETEWA